MYVMALALLLALSSSAVSAALAPVGTPGRVVEQVVAVIRNPAGAPPQPITLTKLAEEARIALVGRGAVDAAFGPLDATALRAALEWLVSQILIADEAARLRVDDVDREEVRAEVKRFEARFPSRDEYRRFLEVNDLSEEELAATLARTLRVSRYLASRVGSGAYVSDEEVERYLRDHGAAGSAPARDVVRAHIAEQKREARVRELVSELRARADVRVIAPLGEGGA